MTHLIGPKNERRQWLEVPQAADHHFESLLRFSYIIYFCIHFGVYPKEKEKNAKFLSRIIITEW